MRMLPQVVIACGIALSLCDRGAAISTVEDAVNNAPRVFRTPATVPPNSPVRPGVLGPNPQQRPDAPGSLTSDDGPGPNDSPSGIPAGMAPWTVAISQSSNLKDDFLCAGALVDKSWVLTAAHCVSTVARRWPNDTAPYVFTDTLDLSKPVRKFAIEEVVLHPNYDAKTLQNDLALIRIDTGNTEAGESIRLQGPPIADSVGEIGTILGWGLTTVVSNPQPGVELKLVQATIIDSGVCFSPINFPALRSASVFCATSLLKYHDVCLRFGGSPIVVYNKQGEIYLAGLVSWAAKCPPDGRPNVYLDVQRYVTWIKSVIGPKAKASR